MRTIRRMREGREIEAYNVAIIGDDCVGKSEFLYQAVLGLSSEIDPTIDDSFRKLIVVDQKVCGLELLDLGYFTFKRYPDVWNREIRDKDGFILVYSVKSRSSLERAMELAKIISAVLESASSPTSSATLKPIVLVGNKSDHAVKSKRFPFQRSPFPIPPVISPSSNSTDHSDKSEHLSFQHLSLATLPIISPLSISNRSQDWRCHSQSSLTASWNIPYCHFFSLPDELLLMIFKRLEPIAALSLAFTCNRFYSFWHGAIRNKKLFESMREELSQATDEAVLVKEGAALANDLKWQFVETSAKLGINLDKVLQVMVQVLREHSAQEKCQSDSPSECCQKQRRAFTTRLLYRIHKCCKLS